MIAFNLGKCPDHLTPDQFLRNHETLANELGVSVQDIVDARMAGAVTLNDFKMLLGKDLSQLGERT